MARQVLVDLDFDSVARILNLLPASTGAEPVTLDQPNAAIEGLNWKDEVRVASTANLTLTGPGASIDGVSLASGDRVLVKDQSDATENGVYVFTGSGTAMTRATDASTFAELEGAVALVVEGTANGGTSWRQTQAGSTLGTDDVLFTSFISASPDASETTKGIAELATQTEVDTGTDDGRVVTPLKLKNSKWFAQAKVFTIGDGSATSFNCDHNLNTRNVGVTVFRNSGDYDDVLADVTRPSVNRVTIGFAAAPSSNAFIVIAQGQLTA
jgi:hypothetical protein